MNQRLLLTGSLVLTLLVGLSLWWFVGRPAPVDLEGAHAEAVASPDHPAAAAPLPKAPAEAAVEPEGERTDIVSIDAAAAARASALEDARILPVRLALPANLPTDEVLRPMVTSFPVAVYGSEAKARSAASDWSPESNALLGLAMTFLGSAPSEQPAEAKAVTVPCDPDGRGGWVARIAKDSPMAVVHLEARYCYLAEPLRLDKLDTQTEAFLEPKLGALLAGAVVLPANLPADFDAAELDKVRVQLTGWSMSGQSHSTSAGLTPERTFEIGGLRAGMNYFIGLDVPSFVPLSDMDVKGREGQRIDKLLELRLGARVRGVVTLPDGSPAVGAEVSAEIEAGRNPMNWMRNGMGRDTKTDEQGRFDLKGVGAGKGALVATLEGYVEARRDELELAEGQLVENLGLALGTGYTVRGIVLWPDRKPAAEVEVTVRPIEAEAGDDATPNARNMRRMMRNFGGGERESITTNELGEFSISGIETSQVAVSASIEREIEGFDATYTAGVPASPSSTAFELVLVEPLPVRGVVLDTAGKPLEDFSVSAERRGEGEGEGRARMGNFSFNFGGGGENRRFRNREDGSFVVYLQPGSYDLKAEAKEYTESAAQQVQVPGAPALEFRLARAGEISGVVLDPNGKPVAEAEVEYSRESRRGGFFGFGGGNDTKTDAEGRFTLKGLPIGNGKLTADAEGWAPSADVEVTLDAGRDLVDVRIQLRVGGRLEGVIYDSTGQPDVGREIMVGNFMGGGGGGMGGNTQSDAAGRFVIEHIAPGKYNVMAMPDMGKLAQAAGEDEEPDMAAVFSQLKMTPVELFDGQTTQVVLGAPPASPVRVSGRITQGEQALKSGLVMALADGKSMLSSMKAGKVQPDGTYSITLDAPGDYTFIVGERMGDQDGVEFQETIPQVPELVLDLELPSGTLRGRVLAADGGPAAGVSLTLEREGRASIFSFDMGRNQETREDGTFELANLRPGTYTLRVGNGGFAGLFGQAARHGTALVSGIQLEKNQVREGIVVQLDAPCTIEGTVRGNDGKPAGGASIFVRDAQGRTINPMSSCTTDADGKFRFDGAAPGNYTLIARREELSSRDSAPVAARAGQPATVELVLETGTMLKVSVEDKEGKTVRASVSVVDSAGREYANLMSTEAFGQMFADGFSSTERRIGPLPPGKYRVTATDDQGKSESKPLNLSGQAERDMRIKLD
jgi:protocatechuate 3,4-dioxygenase beta subunit